MKKLFTAIIATAALGLLSSGVSAQTVRIGTEGAYPPFNSIDSSGNLIGFDIDIANALCEAAKISCEFVVQDWDGMIPGLLAKKYDAIIASMSITEERKKKVDFTGKYYNTPAKFVAPVGKNYDVTPEGLTGLTSPFSVPPSTRTSCATTSPAWKFASMRPRTRPMPIWSRAGSISVTRTRWRSWKDSSKPTKARVSSSSAPTTMCPSGMAWAPGSRCARARTISA